MALILIVLAILVIYTVWYYSIFIRRFPKGPFPLPVVGNLFTIPSSDLHLYFDRLSERYGPVYTLYLPTPHVMLTRYEDIRRCLIARGQDFSTVGPQFDLLSNGVPNGGIISANGDSWREQRRLALKILHDFGLGKALMEERIMTSVQTLLGHLDSLEDKGSVDLFVPFQICLGNVINRILFGYAVEPADSARMLHFLEIITQFFVNFMAREMVLYNSWPWTKRVPVLNWAFKRAERDMRKYYRFIKAEVDAQIECFDPNEPTATTFVHAYMKEMHKTRNPYLCVEQLICVVSDFWLAGMETTITALRWAILYLIKFDYAQTLAYEEIDRVIGRDRHVTTEDRLLMPYVNALILEVERYSVMGTTLFRHCGVGQRVGEMEIPAKTDYLFHVYSDNMHYTADEQYPMDKFRPERYLDEQGKTLRKDAVDRFTAFGMGKRQCPGEGLAKMELFLVLSTLLQHYEFKAAKGCEGVDLSYTYGLIIYPKNQHVMITKRGGGQ